MGAFQDKIASDSAYARQMNEVELEKQREMMRLEMEKSKNVNEHERERIEMEKQKAKVTYELKKAELLLNFQTDIRKIEAELIKTRMVTQASLFEKFIDFMKGTLSTNDALIAQRTKLFEIASKNDTKCAEKVDILSAKQLIDIGAEKVKEMKYLESRLESVLEVVHTDHHSAITKD